jgi:hypothetical protein
MQFGKRSFIAIAALLMMAVPLSAQTLGMLTGTVTFDNAPLPGATVTISSPALQGTRTTNTDVNGNYNFAALPPGQYTVEITMESMEKASVPVRVSLGGTARADATLRLTTVSESLTVTASAPAVLETTEVQTNLQSDLVEELPIGRTIQAAITLAPGVPATARAAHSSSAAVMPMTRCTWSTAPSPTKTCVARRTTCSSKTPSRKRRS